MKKSRSSKTTKPAQSPSVQRVCGRTLVNVLGAATTATIVPLQPSTFPRALAMGDVFEFYRFTSLKIELPPFLATASGAARHYAIGYSNQTFDTPPSTVAQVIELPCASRQDLNSSVYRNFVVTRNELLSNGPLKWYKTIVGSPDALFETQGNIYCVSDAADAEVSLVIEWEVEFSQWNLAAQSPFIGNRPALEPIPGTDLFRVKTQPRPTSNVANSESSDSRKA